MAKQKPIYNVWHTTKFGIGTQPVKANSKKECREKFKKRFPKSKVIDIVKSTIKPIIPAI